MKKFVLTVLAIVAVASPAFAQNGDISSYSDAAGTSCNVLDNVTPFAQIPVYIFHKHTGGATASQFTVTLTGGATMVYSSTLIPASMLSIGTADTDLSIAYGGCQVGDFLICTVGYLGFGTSPACARVTLTPAPTTPIPGEIAAVDCANPSGNLFVPGNGQAIINPDVTCQCNVPVTAKTWGGIKAMYR